MKYKYYHNYERKQIESQLSGIGRWYDNQIVFGRAANLIALLGGDWCEARASKIQLPSG